MFVLVLMLAFSCNADISEETKKLVSDWAPMIWIHPEDPFYPSNIDYYLANNEVMIQYFTLSKLCKLILFILKFHNIYSFCCFCFMLYNAGQRSG